MLTGAVLLLMLSGGGAGVVSFLLLRAGYGFPIWGLLPFLALLLIALVLGALLWWVAGGARPGGPEERPRRGDDV